MPPYRYSYIGICFPFAVPEIRGYFTRILFFVVTAETDKKELWRMPKITRNGVLYMQNPEGKEAGGGLL